MTGTSAALHLTVTASVLAGLPVTVRAVRAASGTPDSRKPVGPGRWLAVVAGLLFVNQVLFTVYALRVRHGDMSYLGGYVPAGWFELAGGPVMTWLAAHTPAPELLAVCALRLPSLLELPLGMLAYLTIVNWLDPWLYRRLTGTAVLALTSASYSITFGLIEWAMHTRYTAEDLALRAVSGVLTVFALRRLAHRPSASAPPAASRRLDPAESAHPGSSAARRPGSAGSAQPGSSAARQPGCAESAQPEAGAPRTAGELLAFAGSAAALGYLILALYDSVLLYSMGRVGQHVPGATVAVAVLAASRFTATRLRRRPVAARAGAGLDTLTSGLSWWLALFLIPALAIRYELGFGSSLFAAAAGLLVIGAATAAALFEVYGRLPLDGRPAAARHWLLGLAVATLLAVLAAGAGLTLPADHSEIHLLWAAALFVLAATLVTAAWDRRAPIT